MAKHAARENKLARIGSYIESLLVDVKRRSYVRLAQLAISITIIFGDCNTNIASSLAKAYQLCL